MQDISYVEQSINIKPYKDIGLALFHTYFTSFRSGIRELLLKAGFTNGFDLDYVYAKSFDLDFKYYMFVDAEYIQKQSFCIIHMISYKFQDQDAFYEMMMDTINDIQKRNGYFYISSMVKECDVNCSINNKNMVNIAYTVLCEKESAKEVCLQLISNDIAMFTRSF